MLKCVSFIFNFHSFNAHKIKRNVTRKKRKYYYVKSFWDIMKDRLSLGLRDMFLWLLSVFPRGHGGEFIHMFELTNFAPVALVTQHTFIQA